MTEINELISGLPLWGSFLIIFLPIFGGLLTVWMRQRSENRRELLKTALEIAKTDFQFTNNEKKFGKDGHIPMSTFVYYHWRYLYMVDKINSSLLRKRLLPEKELDLILSDMEVLFKKYQESGLPFFSRNGSSYK